MAELQRKNGRETEPIHSETKPIPRHRILLLVNSTAGTGTARSRLYQMVLGFALHHCETTVYPILPDQGLSSEEILSDPSVRQGFEVIACSGGDGTLNHVVSAILSLKLPQPLLYIPAGTTNDFAKNLSLPTDPLKASALLENGGVCHYDVGAFNERYFNYIAAFGAFTNVSWGTSQQIKNALGYAAYFLSGVLSAPDALRSRCHMTITMDGVSESGDYLFGAVSNSNSVAGFRTGALSRAELNDGWFEVMLVRAPDDAADIAGLLSAVSEVAQTSGKKLSSRSGEILDNPYISIYRTREISFETDQNIAWTLDGEFGGTPRRVEIRVIHDGMRILAPRK